MHPHPTPGVDRGGRYVALTTYRDDGAGVTTPVWFVGGPHRLRVITGAGAGKVRRIRAHDGVLVAPCDVRGRLTGPPVAGVAAVDADIAAVEHLWSEVVDKYGWQATAITRLEGLRGGGAADRVAITVALGPEG